MDPQLKQARSYFSDERSLALFDLYASAARNDRNFRQIDFRPDLTQMKPRIKQDVTRAMALVKPRKFVLYGGGGHCKEILDTKTDICTVADMFVDDFNGFSAIVDNNITEPVRYELPVMDHKAFKQQYLQSEVIVCITVYDAERAAEIHDSLSADGYVSFIHRDAVNDIWRQMYFDFFAEKGLILKDEVFVHAGCADGYTQKCFLEYAGDDYGRMITFEPSSRDYPLCRRELARVRDCTVVNAGLSDKSGKFGFFQGNWQNSHLSESAESTVDVVSIDEYMEGGRVSLIALDIEGFELKALEGAAETIRKHRPKLAVCVYHKPNDIYEIPMYIKKIDPTYKLALRLYGGGDMRDCVCYAY
jgi:FkbM family methyltransferase